MISNAKPSTSRPRGTRNRKLFASILVLLILCLSSWLFRAPLLSGLAHFWVISDPLTKADAIVVLGGGVDTRPFEAARLYHEGFAPKILIMQCRTNPTTQLGLTPAESDLTRAVLLKQNVPESAIVIVGHGVTSTYDESVAVRAWIQTNANPIKTIIIPTDSFHTRRVRWLFRRQLKSNSVQILLDPIPGRDYNANNWWLHEEGLIAFQNELIKSVFYHLRY